MITDAGLVNVAALQQLQCLNLGCASISDAGLKCVTEQHRVVVGPLMPTCVASLESLLHVDFSECDSVTSVATLQQLRHLYLSHCPIIICRKIMDADLATRGEVLDRCFVAFIVCCVRCVVHVAADLNWSNEELNDTHEVALKQVK